MTYATQYHANYVNIVNDRQRYPEWINKRAGLLIADRLLAPGYTALEIGCGNGGNFHLLRNASRIHGIDIDPEFIEIAGSPEMASALPPTVKLDLECADALAVDLNRTYDLVISVYVLWDRVPLSWAYLDGLLNHLRSDGFFYLYTNARRPACYEQALSRRNIISLIKLGRSSVKTLILDMLRPKEREITTRLTKLGLKLVAKNRIKKANRLTLGMLWRKP